jgi:2-(1,2-epoxy-1,2-dihydrophenyl)acetyl-CoA isomerase
MADDLLFDLRPDGTALLTLNRPDRLNAFGGEMLTLLDRYLAQCERDPAVRCIAVTGAGRAFCSGGDVRGMHDRNTNLAEEPDPSMIVAGLEERVANIRSSSRMTTVRLYTYPKPTIALVNGYAIGAGFVIALSCDIRLCSSTARMSTGYRNVGLSGDYGGSYFLPHLVGSSRARELYFTGEMVEAPRALELGLVNHVYPAETFMEDALAFCAQIAQGPTATFARMKENLNLAETTGLLAVLDRESAHHVYGSASRDAREAMRAFVEKRPPSFIGQ